MITIDGHELSLEQFGRVLTSIVKAMGIAARAGRSRVPSKGRPQYKKPTRLPDSGSDSDTFRAQTGRTFSALGPFGPRPSVNETRWPS